MSSAGLSVQPDALRPFGGPRLSTLHQFQGGYSDAMLWGTYRPGLYFGEPHGSSFAYEEVKAGTPHYVCPPLAMGKASVPACRLADA